MLSKMDHEMNRLMQILCALKMMKRNARARNIEEVRNKSQIKLVQPYVPFPREWDLLTEE